VVLEQPHAAGVTQRVEIEEVAGGVPVPEEV
jgi:hypothetical protein